MIIGIVFLILGTIECITSFQKREERIYTTATIVNIEEYKTGDPDNPKGHRVYVEFEVNDEKIVSELNTYNSKDRIGMEKEIYYFDNDMEMVYEKGSEIFLILFPIVGTISAILGALITFHRKVQTFFLELPLIKIRYYKNFIRGRESK